MTAKLSIIIPVYNVETYVGQTLDSVFDTSAQVDDFEVIVVDDGTKDGSMEVVKRYADRPNLTIIEQENRGLSAARNRGLASASGEYVWFVDSDDYLLEDGVGTVVRLLEEHSSADVLVFPIRREFSDTRKPMIDPVIEEMQRTSGRDYLRQNRRATPCFRFVFKRKMTESRWLSFPVGLLHEDIYWGPVLLYLAERIAVMTQPVYAYRQRPGSIMDTVTIRSSYDLVSVHRRLMDFMEKEVAPEDHPFFLSYCFRTLKWSYSLNSRLYGTKDFRRFVHSCGLYVWKNWNLAYPGSTRKKKARRLFFCELPGLYGKFFKA